MLRAIVYGIDHLNTAICRLTKWIMIPLVAVMIFEAAARYFFHSPTIWGTELAMMIFGIYITACESFRGGKSSANAGFIICRALLAGCVAYFIYI